ncbi:ead/Ea22-like family protein [Enterobacter hormaechei]
MSNIDKRALRDAAEKASTDNHTQDEWFHYLRCSTPETVLALLDELEAAEKRIAELEAREVKLPKPISVLHRRDFGDAHRSIYAYPEAEVNAALADAGINVAVAGKGEVS